MVCYHIRLFIKTRSIYGDRYCNHGLTDINDLPYALCIASRPTVFHCLRKSQYEMKKMPEFTYSKSLFVSDLRMATQLVRERSFHTFQKFNACSTWMNLPMSPYLICNCIYQNSDLHNVDRGFALPALFSIETFDERIRQDGT